jgi:5'-3' exonuclease
MGIPSYFSHVMRNYSSVKKWKKVHVDYLFMDCNSIIYQTIYYLQSIGSSLESKHIYEIIYKSILQHIYLVSPKIHTYVAFDGIAPFAKMKQQRERRFRSKMIEKIQSKIVQQTQSYNIHEQTIHPIQDQSLKFDTSCITPGTDFMNNLSIYLIQKFDSNKTIHLSSSIESGEGEHKLFRILRNDITLNKNTHIYIYGLDADLIILSLKHIHLAKITLYREKLKKNSDIINPLNIFTSYYDIIDIKSLAYDIQKQLSNYSHEPYLSRIQDYIFLSFFLGNDFMPHNPTLPIRTFGIKELIRVYREVIAIDPMKYLICDYKVQWLHVHEMLNVLIRREKEYLHRECDHFMKESMKSFTLTKNTLDKVPLMCNDIMYYIDINIVGWEKRYYEYLFKIESTKDNIREICIKYIKGLHWCFSYYTTGNIDNKWIYEYNYPPLFSDIVKYIPRSNDFMFDELENNPHSNDFQLSYVIPYSSYSLLPKSLYTKMMEYINVYGINTDLSSYELQWDFCSYLWEAHPILPKMNVDKMIEYIEV